MKHITYIAHYGIKGQEWGVRNGPPYPLSDKKHAQVVDKTEKPNTKRAWKEAVEEHKQKRAEFDKENNQKLLNAWTDFVKHAGNKKERKAYLNVYRTLKKDIEARRLDLDNKYEKVELEAFRDYQIEHSIFKNWYKNASEEELREDVKNKEELRKELITLGVVVGIGAAAYICYKKGVINGVMNKIDEAALKKSGLTIDEIGKEMQMQLRENLKTMDMILDKDCPINRFHGSSDFDISKLVDGEPLYTTISKHDSLIYSAYLKSRTGTGSYQVHMKTLKDVKVAGEETLERIFDKVWSDPSNNYKHELAESLLTKFPSLELYKRQGGDWEDKVINAIGREVGRLNPNSGYDQNFATAMYSLVLRGKDQKIFFDAVKQENYDAIIDMFDRSLGGFAGKDIQAPTIFLDPKSTLVKTGIDEIKSRGALEIQVDAIMKYVKDGKGVVEDMSKWHFVK